MGASVAERDFCFGSPGVLSDSSPSMSTACVWLLESWCGVEPLELGSSRCCDKEVTRGGFRWLCEDVATPAATDAYEDRRKADDMEVLEVKVEVDVLQR